MKKILAVLCLAMILYVGYQAVILSGEGDDPAIDGIKAEAGKIVNQMTDMYEEYGSAATKQVEDAIGEKMEQADEALEEIAGQADEAIEDAARSAVEGAKQGFIRSLKKSFNDFFDNLADEDAGE